MRFMMMAAACALTMTAVPVLAVAPAILSSPGALRPDMGAVRLSWRSQIQLNGPLFLWFLRDGGVPEDEADLLRFTRSPGMPMVGGNMIDSRPMIMSVRPGLYHLIAYSVTCDTLPPMESACFPKGMQMPTGRLAVSPVSFDVRKGELTDAGEFVLEMPGDFDLGGAMSYKEAIDSQLAMAVRWRPIAAALPVKFAAMKAGPPPKAGASVLSNIRCDVKRGSAYYPFRC